jgi:Protein of unknown function (DUF1275)
MPAGMIPTISALRSSEAGRRRGGGSPDRGPMAVLNRAALAVPGGGTMVMARFDREWILQGTMAASETRATIPLLLSLNAGYVDTAGFLALQGLFAAHVTGNFVTLGASLALGTSGAIAKLLALPVFCAVVIVSRLLDTVLSNRIGIVFEVLLGLKVLLLIGGAALAIKWSPIHDGDSWHAILTGILVAAMADADDDDHRHQWSAQAIEVEYSGRIWWIAERRIRNVPLSQKRRPRCTAAYGAKRPFVEKPTSAKRHERTCESV